MTRGKVTSYHIAKLAGVSQPTVSRALRNDRNVSQATQRKIKRIARKLNYTVDVSARNLRSNKTKTIALLFYEEQTADDSPINQFFHTMLVSITRASVARGYDLLISFQQASNNWGRDYDDANRADGIIFLGYGDYVSYAKSIANLNTHFITWGPVLPDQPGYFIGCDNVQSAYIATKHLIDNGHQKIAFLGEKTEHSPEVNQRYQGYVNALNDSGITVNPELQIDCITSEKSGNQAAEILIAKEQPFDAAFCSSDLIAIGAIKSFYENNLMVPKDVAVVGFDNIPSSSYFNPSITTIEQDTALAGKLLVDNLIGLIEGKSITSKLINSKLIIRESCGASA